MIDLHVHTKYSDGTDTVEELLKKAEELKIEYISITDHDNCKAYEELEKIKINDYYTGNIIPGIEIKCAYGSRLIELLGYNIDNKKMQEWANEFYKDKTKEKLQQKYFDILYEKCKELDLTIKAKQEIQFDSKVNWASVVIYNEIKQYSENYDKLPEDFFESFNVFSKKYCSDKTGHWYIDKTKDYPSVEEAAEIIKKCGGLVFAPHIYIYSWINNYDEHVKTLIEKYNIDGLECFHSEFNKEQMEEAIKIAEKYNLYISGGSDYHGSNKLDVKLAYGKDNIKVDSRYIQNWIDKR